MGESGIGVVIGTIQSQLGLLVPSCTGGLVSVTVTALSLQTRICFLSKIKNKLSSARTPKESKF